MSIVIPDSIEPYIGYKYLSINPGINWLVSDHGGMPWPPGDKAVADCLRDNLPYSWQAVTKGTVPGYELPVVEATQVNAPPGMVYVNTTSGVTISNNTFTGSGTGVAVSDPLGRSPMPRLILPEQLEWRWLPQIHEPVTNECTCGIYAVSAPKLCAAYYRPGKVLVEVALWGRVIVGDKGARGQYAKITRIGSIPAKALGVDPEKLRKQYGVEDTTPVPYLGPDPSSAGSDFQKMLIRQIASGTMSKALAQHTTLLQGRPKPKLSARFGRWLANLGIGKWWEMPALVAMALGFVGATLAALVGVVSLIDYLL